MENGLRILPVRIYLRIINRILGGCGVLTFTDEGTQDRTFTFASVPFRFEMPAWETVSVSRASIQHQHLPPDSLPGTPDRTRKLHLQSSYHTLCQTSNTLLHLPDLLRRNPIFMKSPGTNNSPVQFSGNFLRHPSADHLILMPRKIQNRRSRTHRTIP